MDCQILGERTKLIDTRNRTALNEREANSGKYLTEVPAGPANGDTSTEEKV